MGKGRRPTPTQIKKTAGTIRASRTNKAEPATKGIPVPPPHLSSRARRSWFLVMPLLQGMGVVGEPDAFALERLCECHAEIVTLQTIINKQGHTYECETESGGTMVRPRPEVPMLSDADRRFKGYLVEFGLTPAARSKVSTSEQKEVDPADAYDIRRA